MTGHLYGRLDLVGPWWIVRCDSHVRQRLKRCFPRMPRDPGKALRISNTPENARDLEWFLERYPMECASIDELIRQSRTHRDQEVAIHELLVSPGVGPAIELAKPAREYQVHAERLLELKGGLLLADDVGLGKTVTAICSLVRPENRPALVVCPAHLPTHWMEKIGEFLPTLTVVAPKKGTPYEMRWVVRGGQRERFDGGLPDVIVMSYFKLRGWADELAGKVRLVVFDEAQQLRANGSQVYAAAQHVARRARRREGLSATPIYNYGGEFFNVVECLLPGALGEHDEFIREWCTYGGQKAKLRDPAEFGDYLRREGIMLRRTREDVGRELPALSKIAHPVESNPDVITNLGSDAVRLAEIVLQHNESFRGEKMQAAGELDARLRQATGIAKAPYVAAFVRMLLDTEPRVVLFGWHREVYTIWLEQLKEFNPLLYTGSESTNQKDAAVHRFADAEERVEPCRVLIMSLRSGAGVDGLQHVCRTVVFGELDWSPGVHEQCVGRVHRDGQRDPVIAYYLHADDGADPVILNVLGVKREQIEGVRSPNRPLVERLDSGESIRDLAREFLARRRHAAAHEVA